MIEEPLDPANQSLADALRASFRVLKLIMLGVVILFLGSGTFRVDQNEVVVLSRFGKQVGPPLGPGLHVALPYPIHSKVRVPTVARTILIDAFWLNQTDAEKARDLSEAGARTSGLDPATDGALLTGDRAIMHLLTKASYKITDANNFVKNVSDESKLLQSVIHESTVAQAVRTTADVLWKDPARMVDKVRARAQSQLDALESGITIEILSVEKSHYPLQVKDDFLALSEAENKMRQLIQQANEEWEKKLKGAAGPAWEPLRQEIEKLDQVEGEAGQAPIIQKIEKILTEEATGEAAKKIQAAISLRNKIVQEAQTRSERFLTFLDAYRRDPELVRERLLQDMIGEIFSQASLSRWFLPPGHKVIWLNKNPEETRQQEREARLKKTQDARK